MSRLTRLLRRACLRRAAGFVLFGMLCLVGVGTSFGAVQHAVRSSASVEVPAVLVPGQAVTVRLAGFPAGSQVRVGLGRFFLPLCNCDASNVFPRIDQSGILVPSSGAVSVSWTVPTTYAECVATPCENMAGNEGTYLPGEPVVVSAITANNEAFAETDATIGAQTASKDLSLLVMGDSYSAGNGAGDYYGPSGCRRSRKNYGADFAALLQAAPIRQSTTATTVACSGATTADFFASQDGNPPQIDAVNQGYDLILLTIGGDDVSFADIVEQCLVNKTKEGSQCLRYLDQTIGLLEGSTVAASLTHVLAAIHDHAPAAKIVLLGYPYLEGDPDYDLVDRNEGSTSVAGTACAVRSGKTNLVTVGQCLDEIGNLGNTLEETTVDKLNSTDGGSPFVFVSTQKLFAGTQPGFLGPNHELFASHVNPNRWFIQPFVDADSGLGTIEAKWGGDNVFYHPDPAGWEEEAKLLAATPAVPKHPAVPAPQRSGERAATPSEEAAIERTLVAYWKATVNRPCQENAAPPTPESFQFAFVSLSDERYALANTADIDCTNAVAYFMERPQRTGAGWDVLAPFDGLSAPCVDYGYLPESVLRDFQVSGTGATSSTGPC
jgi:hypothetical protein